ncbi:MAG: class I SAM-dependent methyltransferase [Candidatus Aenigmarchaeota archaeon]|nr:class I SAM-dependent methyltransferase [Candidatus Aenigmarchaeota archaeon]
MDVKIVKVLDKIYTEDKENKYWRVPRTSGQLLRSIALSITAKNILEIGCSVGYSALWLASSGAYVYTIESDKDRADLAEKHFKEAGLNNKIIILRGDALEILSKWNKKVDFVFMDANKNEYADYYKKIYPFIKKGGILIADNVISHKESSKTFLDVVCKDKRVISQLIEIDNGLMFIVKK